ncbi:MAG: hypothetical protein SV422_00935 [Pseudomonadota bacterium]|nr:hypothetical protein [Pseudomonadota bacterium]
MVDPMRFFGIERDDFLDASRWTNVVIEASVDRAGEISVLYLYTPAVIVRLSAHELGESRWEYSVLECQVVNEIVRTRQELEVEVLGRKFPVAEPQFSILASVGAFTGIRVLPHSVEISKSQWREAEDGLEITHSGGIYTIGTNHLGCMTFRSEAPGNS